MGLFQKIIILLNFRPITYLFRPIYAFGLNRLLARLKNHPAVHSIYGCGSFFEGECLYGLSDIDLILIIDESYTRADEDPYRITETYNWVRRFFPFLGNWSEKAENLIFLSEVRSGFPVPESFRLRWKQGHLFHLYGKAFPKELVAGPISISEVVTEMDTLLRMVLTKGEVHTSNLLFWKRIFSKLIALTDTLGFVELAEEMRNNKKMTFLQDPDILLFIRKSAPEELFQLLLDLTRGVFNGILKKTDYFPVTYAVLDDGDQRILAEPSLKPKMNRSKALTEICKAAELQLGTLRSSLFGIAPRLNYFSMDKPITVIEIQKKAYQGLRILLKSFLKHGKESESVLVRVQGFLFILCKMETYVEVVPLNPFVFANIHARSLNGSESFEMPASVYQEQRTTSERIFLALAGLYRRNEGRIKQMPYPCLYLEDDLVVLRDAFHRMRVFGLHSDGVDIRSPSLLVNFLSNKHPSCKPFLNDLLDYYRHLTGERIQKRCANNLYRCLHHFMAQMLSGASNISLDEHWKRLGMTVGIITRNRSADLKEMLGSLMNQIRPADEVLIVDNGSNDQTREVVEGFKGRLPVSYYFLPEASIPRARNLVIEKAKNEIICFTDDDCIVDPGWLDTVERGFLRADNIGMVGGWVKHEPALQPSMIDIYYSLFHHNTT
jgi:predicted nucleotidyltransferase